MRFRQAASGHWIPVEEDKPAKRKPNKKQAEGPRRDATGAVFYDEGGGQTQPPDPAGGGADEGAGDV